jgi:O-antigen/teichoic acid export membrane protein
MRLLSGFWHQVQMRTSARIGKNALALLAAQAGSRLFSLLLTAQFVRSLGAAGLGRYLLAITVETVALGVVDLGLNILTVRELARERTLEDSEAFWGAVLGLKLLAALAGIALLNGVVAPALFPDERRLLIAIASLALLPESFSGAAQALVRARQRMEVGSTVALLVRALAAVAGIVLLLWGRDERAVLVSFVLVSLLEAATFLVILRAWKVRARWRAGFRCWRSTLREALPFAASAIAAMLYMRLDFLLLSYWQGNLATGVYGTAYRLWEALGMMPASLLDALFPEMARLGGSGQGRLRLRRLYRQGFWALLALVAVAGLPCFLLAPQLIHLLYGAGEGTADAIGILRVLLVVAPLTYLYLLSGHVLYAIGRQRFVSAAVIAVTLLNGVLNALAISRWSYWGAVGVACTTEVALFILLFGGTRRFLGVQEDPPAQEERP